MGGEAILSSRETYLVVESGQLRSGPALSANDVCPRRAVAEGGNRPEFGQHDVRRAVRPRLPGGLFLLVGAGGGPKKSASCPAPPRPCFKRRRRAEDDPMVCPYEWVFTPENVKTDRGNAAIFEPDANSAPNGGAETVLKTTVQRL